MPFPTGWNAVAGGGLQKPNGYRSKRIYYTGTTTTDYEDQAQAFRDVLGGENMDVFDPVVAGATTQTTYPPSPYRGARKASAADPTAPIVVPEVYVQYIYILNKGVEDLLFSFDGIRDHGKVPSGQARIMERQEAGIAVKSASGGVDYEVEAW